VITLEDCIAFSGLTEQEVLAIAEHEHIPEVAAAALAECLLSSRAGSGQIRDMICEDIRAALDRGDVKHAAELCSALRHFFDCHPDASCTEPLPAHCPRGSHECFRTRS
jgi:hypothetical protein